MANVANFCQNIPTKWVSIIGFIGFGRAAAMQKLPFHLKASVYLGDFYHGVSRAGDFPARIPARLMLGDLVNESAKE